MEVTIPDVASSIPEGGSVVDYDIAQEINAFVETKAGVKGLVDSGVAKIPRFFVHSPENSNVNNLLQVPIIDMIGFDSFRRTEVVDAIGRASDEWGFFQIVNHGIPGRVIDEMLLGVRRLHEQSKEAKMELQSCDCKQQVGLLCGGLFLNKSSALKWRDTIKIDFQDREMDPELVPEIFRKEATEYMRHVKHICKTLSELLSEALGLETDYLPSTGCMETEVLLGNYYPACPEPDLTLGAASHKDPSFLTIVVQENMGGLQVHHQNQWVDVPPLPGALVVNIGDLMQLLTNDRFKSANHRVVVREVESRTSVACFFFPSRANKLKVYEPIKELLCDKPPLYRGTHMKEFVSTISSDGRGSASRIPCFKVL